MNSKFLIRVFLIVFVVGIVAGGTFGMIAGLVVLSLIYNFAVCLFFSIFVSAFFVWSFWIRFRAYDWVIVIRNLIVIFLISAFLTAMYSIENGDLGFSRHEVYFIFGCSFISSFIFAAWFSLAEFFPATPIHQKTLSIVEKMNKVSLPIETEEKE